MSVAVPASMPPGVGGSAGANYQNLNSAINIAIFGGRYRQAPAYLILEDDMIAQLSGQFGISPERFTTVLGRVTANTLHWSDRNPYFGHLAQLDAWNRRGRVEHPPFSALLCVLSLAAERMQEDENYSALNYYERLFEILGISDQTRKNKLKSNASSTLKFWESLNKWLAENDYEFGRPTAKAVNGWRYASYALSQALIREADRQRLHGLFTEFGLSPHEQASEPELSLYLHEWMGGPGPSVWLKKIWAVPDLRPRVAAAARAELENWDGADVIDATGGMVRRTLSWAAQLVTFPRPELRLYLTTAHIDAAPRLSLEAAASRAAVEAFSECDEGIRLNPVSTGEFSVLEPTRGIALSALMLASFELEDSSGKLTLKRTARHIVPLAKLDTGPYYREVSRAALLRRHLILCSDGWKERVEAHLRQYALPSYTGFAAQELSGLPEGWALFTNVEIVRAAEEASNDLQMLVPLAEGAALEIAGGLKLGHGLWHSEAPPEIGAVVERGPITVQIRERSVAGTDRIVARGQSSDRAAKLPLSGLSLPPDNDFVVVVADNGRDQIEGALSLRSADRPRPLRSSDTPELAYYLSPQNQSGLDSASGQASAPEGALVVRGMKIELTGRPQRDWLASCKPEPLVILQRIERDGEEDDDDDSPPPRYSFRRFVDTSGACIQRGYHHWICEPFEAGEARNAPKRMTCQNCSTTVLTHHRVRYDR